jgi:hypothetical protein
MCGTIGSGGRGDGGGGSGGGDDGRPPRRGTRLAPELDRRLVSDEPLDEIIGWWNNSAAGFGNEAIHLHNFSDNELAVHVISLVSGCGDDNADNRIANLDFLWPHLGLDGAKLADPAYVEQVILEFIAKLETARTELRKAEG